MGGFFDFLRMILGWKSGTTAEPVEPIGPCRITDACTFQAGAVDFCVFRSGGTDAHVHQAGAVD